ncbi:MULTISPECIES: hypothetical protein [Luteimonas]|uniref:hypothetical protein n=1 Tax=Luteimonas TaxID=83614 RepID=UPI000C7AD95C|nr:MULTISPECIES: hypothetical protein [Luteimonas]
MSAVWQPYANLHGDSGVQAWRLDARELAIEFRDGAVYVYSARRLGARRFAALRRAARTGRGLATRISRDARSDYTARYDTRDAYAAAH